MASVAETIRAELSREGRASAELLARIEAALRAEPRNADLWMLRGDAIQLSDELTNPFTEVERSYRTATEIDPKFVRAYEALGRFWFVIMNDAGKAKTFFEQAVKLGAGESAQNALQKVTERLRGR